MFPLSNRVWLSKTKLKNIKYKILTFNPEILKEKIPKDPKTAEAAKPVSKPNVLQLSFKIINSIQLDYFYY